MKKKTVAKKAVKKAAKKAAKPRSAAPAPKKAVAKKAAPSKKTPAPVKKAVAPAAAQAPAGKPAKKASNTQEIVSPLDDRIIVSVPEEGERKTASGLILVGESNEGENIKGTVRAVGRGHLNKKGKIRPLALKVGDEILFPKVAGSKVQVAGTEMYILRESEVLGVLN
jgi:chaperonin GroES